MTRWLKQFDQPTGPSMVQLALGSPAPVRPAQHASQPAYRRASNPLTLRKMSRLACSHQNYTVSGNFPQFSTLAVHSHEWRDAQIAVSIAPISTQGWLCHPRFAPLKLACQTPLDRRRNMRVRRTRSLGTCETALVKLGRKLSMLSVRGPMTPL